ncbi:RICIN domain-containing protein [Flavobacterium johnsoniae]|uniref:RICIN domain-containing protein n=1 Tax=Flavobacterium johnsoniae TaxID=986 RepID=UPI0025AF895F|nr:RICIN domain-containing protein [Flavobacterium johnsoniae]WJS93832.1 RICIN domain-containing protein [Flavobacterium johnsoniae]
MKRRLLFNLSFLFREKNHLSRKENRQSNFRIFTFVFVFLLTINLISAQTKTITKAQYYDKTLAMLIGSCGGVVTGYEYLKVYNTPDGFYQAGATVKQPVEPLLGLPDSWFILLNGTLGGTTKDEFNYFSNYEDGKIYSDDDQHVEVFNQHILEKFGPSVTYQDIRKEWIDHDLRDFGGTADALGLLSSKNLIAPLFGKRENGNNGHWLPECYIEHEMMGANFPGLPYKAAEYVEKFSSMSGQGEALTWGQYWAAAHAIAYFETDARVVLQKSMEVVPGNSWIRGMYDVAVALHQKYPNDWRAAVRELWTEKYRNFYAVGYDKIMLLSDPNHGTGFLAILYGQNDYMETLKICSLAGGDGDCTAANVCGMMGIIKGMAGTPQEFIDHIYKNGTGVWINDTAHGLHMHKDFPRDSKFTDLAAQFQRNAERILRANDGIVTGSSYIIKNETSIAKISSANYDFEKGDLTNWNTWNSAGSSNTIWAEKQYNATTKASLAATGLFKGTVITDSNTAEAKLYQTITGLKPNTTYKIEGRINSAAGREARLFAENYGGTYVYASVLNGLTAFPYKYLYIKTGATNTSLNVGLHAVPTTNASKWCNIDDIVITEVPTIPITTYEAESAVLAGGVTSATSATASGTNYITGLTSSSASVTFNVNSDYKGEKVIRIYYANSGAKILQVLELNGVNIGNVEFMDTGLATAFSQNYIEAPLDLNKGANTIKILGATNGVNIDKIDVLNSYNGARPGDDSDIISGGIYKITARHSGKSLNVNGVSNDNGALFSQWDYVGGANQKFRVEAIGNGTYAIYAVHSNKAVDVLGSSTANDASVGQWDYVHGGNQQWGIVSLSNGSFKLVNNHSGKCLEVTGAGTINGSLVTQNDYADLSNQQWNFEKIGDATTPVSKGIYKIVNRNSGKVIDIAGVSQNNDAAVSQWDDLGGTNQKFQLELTSGGYYKITALHSNKTIGIAGSSTANGALATQRDYANTSNQQWSIVPVSGNYFKMINRLSGKALEIPGSSTTNGAQLGQLDSNEQTTQQWTFVKLDNGQGVLGKPGKAEEVLAVDEVEIQNNEIKITVYPNPTKGLVNVLVSNPQEEIQIQVYGMNGKQIYDKSYGIDNSINLDLNDLPKGIYIMKVKTGSKISTQKIILN